MAHHQVDWAADFLGLPLVSLHAVPEKERIVCLPSVISQHESLRPLLWKAKAPVIQQSLHESRDGGDEWDPRLPPGLLLYLFQQTEQKIQAFHLMNARVRDMMEMWKGRNCALTSDKGRKAASCNVTAEQHGNKSKNGETWERSHTHSTWRRCLQKAEELPVIIIAFPIWHHAVELIHQLCLHLRTHTFSQEMRVSSLTKTPAKNTHTYTRTHTTE